MSTLRAHHVFNMHTRLSLSKYTHIFLLAHRALAQRTFSKVRSMRSSLRRGANSFHFSRLPYLHLILLLLCKSIKLQSANIDHMPLKWSSRERKKTIADWATATHRRWQHTHTHTRALAYRTHARLFGFCKYWRPKFLRKQSNLPYLQLKRKKKWKIQTKMWATIRRVRLEQNKWAIEENVVVACLMRPMNN